ncbi:MAG: hypothetical protein E7Z84_00730 [Methanosphaera stadtmanae]|nr:hypothetical protein [Methanosphaera stadtmanae]
MMPKPNKDNYNQNTHKSDFERFNSERVLVETKPNMILYVDNFILKIILLFLMILMFAPILTFIHEIQLSLMNSFNFVLPNMTFIAELVLIFLILILGAKIVIDLFEWDNTLYVLTDSRIVIQRGWFNKEKIMMSYNKIQDIDISQSIMERIFNVGDIIIYGANDNSETVLYAIPKPKEIEEIIFNSLNGQGYNPNYNNYHSNPNYISQVPPNMNYQDQKPNQGYPHPQEMNQQTYGTQHSQQYPKEGYNNKANDDGHYFDVEESYVNNNYEPKHKGYEEKWKNTKKDYNRKQPTKEEVFKKHQENFKKYNK